MITFRLIIRSLMVGMIMGYSLEGIGIDIQSSESQPPPPPITLPLESKPDKITLPRGYKPIPYAQQFMTYRNIYNHIDQSNYNFTTTHLPGLFDILQYGFAKVTDFIEGDKNQKPERREQALDDLRNLYILAVRLEKNGQLSQAYFLVINFFMAAIVDAYKGITPQEFSDYGKMSDYDPKIIKDAITTGDLGNLENMVSMESLNIPIRIYKKDVRIDKNNLKDPKRTTFFVPFIAIIYKGTQGISPRTFVDQKFGNENYNLEIALFDTALVPYRMTFHAKQQKPGTKADPHYSKFNSTFSLLSHDMSHIKEQAEKEDFFWVDYGINWADELRKIDKIRKQMSVNSNEYKILTNGLFILSHELKNVTVRPPELLGEIFHISVPRFQQ
ncbi:MAG TPA: hypothetical protein VNJ29_00770, partial [Candidatus Nitrosotenuis sp.]|nr:hypothetical protein [Candidatus Nitrosotenuis sp.]